MPADPAPRAADSTTNGRTPGRTPSSSRGHDPVPVCMAKKWLPVSHRHGCAIYRHKNVSAEQQGVIGGEVMVSAIIRGSPERCLAALTSSRCCNSILGPASVVEELQQSADGATKVLRITLAQPFSTHPSSTSTTSSSAAGSTATAPARGSVLARWCSRLLWRRCAVVQQQVWQDPRGIYCLTFSSVQQDQLQHIQRQQQRLEPQQQADGQQQLRHRSSGAAGKLPQPSHKVQLHASCNHSSGASSGDSGNSHQQQQQHPRSRREQQQHQQQQQAAASQAVPLLLRPLWLLLGWLGSLLAAVAALLGLQRGSSSSSCTGGGWRSSSSSSRCWGLWGPVPVAVAGGFTVAGLDGGVDGAGAASETLVTSILQVDLGGCLAGGGGAPGGTNSSRSSSSSSSSSSSLILSAAVRAGVVAALVDQMLSAVERVKQEVEHPPPAGTQQQQGSSPCSSPSCSSSSSKCSSWLQGLASGLGSVASLALAPLTAWQQPQQLLHRRASSLTQRLRSQATAGHAAAATVGAQRAGSGVGSGGGGCFAGGAAAAAAAVPGSGDSGGDRAQDLVGRDKEGQPLSGLCNPAFWSPLHQPGCPSLFQVRGPTYLADHVKVRAGPSAYTLLAVDLVSTPSAVHHLARFLPSVRRSRAASAFVINMMVPAAGDVMNLVMTFGSSRPWPVPARGSSGSSRRGSSGSSGGGDSGKGPAAGSVHGSSGGGAGSATQGGSSSGSSSGGDDGSSSGFTNTLTRFLLADDQERSNMFKMIPHIEVGPWMLQGMVGTTPVIMGRKLETTYHLTERYMEVDIDVTTCRTAGFIVQSIRGATTSLVVDLCYLLEAQRPQELPEELIGAVRFSNIDMAATTALDISQEVPCWPEPWG